MVSFVENLSVELSGDTAVSKLPEERKTLHREDIENCLGKRPHVLEDVNALL